MAESMKGGGTAQNLPLCGSDKGNDRQQYHADGWVQKARNKGGIVFVDLRDRFGIMQLIFENAASMKPDLKKPES